MLIVGVYHPKHDVNVGSLWRSALAFNADMLVVIGGERLRRQASDTTNAAAMLPLVAYESWEAFTASRPRDVPLVAVELVEGATELPDFVHPRRALYLLGAEDHGLPPKVLERAQHRIVIPSGNLNVAVAGSIVMYDRAMKLGR